MTGTRFQLALEVERLRLGGEGEVGAQPSQPKFEAPQFLRVLGELLPQRGMLMA